MHSHKWSGVLVALAALFCSTRALVAQPAPGPVKGDAGKGAKLYYLHGCYGCHGYAGYGRKDLNHTGSPLLSTEEVFRAFLRARADVAPLLPSTSMPNYPANALGDAQVRDLYAFVRSMPANVPSATRLPAMKAILDSAAKPWKP